ncbi:MAG: VCBS repeat-containing protein [Minicystis sp.]
MGTARARQSAGDWKIFNVADTNDDGLADLHWISLSTNQMAVWLMHGAHVLAPGRAIPGPPGTGWTAVTTADFNRDGFNDVIWTNTERDTAAVWLLSGTHLLAPGPEIAGPPGHGWVVGNAGDTNGDGMGDAVWYDSTTSRAAVWLMNGARLLAPGPPIPAPPGTGWQLTNVADANGDNLADIFWSNPDTNTMAVWLLNGAQLLAPGPEIPGPPGEGWIAITAADFNRDGMSDMILDEPPQRHHGRVADERRAAARARAGDPGATRRGLGHRICRRHQR